MDIRLIVVDLDGTLMQKDETVSPRAQAAFARAREKGIRAVVATGRSMAEGQHGAEAIGADGYMITLAGAQIMDRQTGREIYVRHLPLEQSLAVADIMDASEQTYFQLYSGTDLVSTHKAVTRIYDCELPVGYAEAAVKKMILVPNLREYLEKTGKPGEKYFILSKEPGRIEAIRQEMEKIPDMFVVRAHPYGIETMQKNVNKGTALRILREHLGLKKEQVLVMGDSENDLALFAEGGFRVAMGNAYPCLKEQADYIAPRFDEDGAARAIEELLLRD